MRREELLKRVSVDPQICFGRPCIRGTRIWVSLFVDNLADGISESELLSAYPQIQPEDIRAALAYAAEMTRERVIPVPVGTVPSEDREFEREARPEGYGYWPVRSS